MIVLHFNSLVGQTSKQMPVSIRDGVINTPVRFLWSPLTTCLIACSKAHFYSSLMNGQSVGKLWKAQSQSCTTSPSRLHCDRGHLNCQPVAPYYQIAVLFFVLFFLDI